MSEEEKKAIEYFKEKIKNKLPLYEETYIDGELYRINILQLETKFTEEQANKMEILLNLIEKQQKELNSLKEIEQLHQEENGKLRVELEQEKENNKEYERIIDIWDERPYRKRYLEERRKEQPNLLYPDADEIYQKYYEEKEKNKELEEKLKIATAMLTKGTYPEKNKGDNDSDKQFIAVDKIKEIVDECIEKKANVITGKEEYCFNTNDNSFLAHKIVELLEEV